MTDESIVFEVERLTHGGEGVARLPSGKVVFVAGALPGERVRARITLEKKRFARAESLEVLEPSASRRPLDCQHEAAGCGGCGLRHVVDAESLPLKAHAAYGEVRKIARDIDAWPELELDPTTPLDAWRERVRMQVDPSGLGFYERGSHEVLPVPECHAMHPEVRAAVSDLAAILRETRGPLPRSVLVERVGGEIYVSWGGEVSGERETRLVAGWPGVRVGWGKRARHLGAVWMEERHDDVSFSRRVGTFGQAHAAANAVLRQRVREVTRAVGAERVLDLYAGSGNFSLMCGLEAGAVLGLEMSKGAIEGLTRSAGANAMPHVRGAVCDLRRGIPKRHGKQPWDLVVLDPPRTGAAEVMGDLLRLAPESVLYIACEPTVMARDLKMLAGSYGVVSVVAVDMFPRTPHLEMIVQLKQRESVR